jgi:hypothetical protein
MNDEIRNQLTDTWSIPAYARNHLWVEGMSGAAQAEGEHGEFELPSPSPDLTIYWQDVHQGAALAHMPYKPATLNWDGRVRIGGYVDAIHITPINGGEVTVAVIHLGGQPLHHHIEPYATPYAREQASFAPDFHTALCSNVAESFSTWLALEDSPLTRMAYDSMLNNLRLHCFGRLADDASGWGNLFALPILLEAVTVFGS